MNDHAVARNTAWILGCRILHALAQLAVGMVTARYLGPEDYGLIHFAASVTAFGVPVMQLGFQSTLVQEYVEKRAPEEELLGTALVLNLISGALCALLVTGAVMAAGDRQRTVICGLYSLSLVFRALELVGLRFQAGLQAKHSSLAALWGYLAVSAFRIWLLAAGKGTAWFALSHSVEFAVAGAVLLIRCRRSGMGRLRFRWKTAGLLLSRSRHYIPAALLVTCFQNIDRVLLTALQGETANGLYTCAVTCANLTGFVFYALVDSLRPVILKSAPGPDFRRHMAGLYGLMLWLGLCQSGAFSLLAGPVVGLLYGEAYRAAVPVLRILCWGTAFSMMGAARDVWLLAAGKHGLLWRINLCGALASLVLNALLIPALGPEGAAAASVLTQVVTNFLLGFWMPGMGENQALLLRGLNVRETLAWARGIFWRRS